MLVINVICLDCMRVDSSIVVINTVEGTFIDPPEHNGPAFIIGSSAEFIMHLE